jgi:CubicO group peptidase (beta-lactamase class C family)
MIGASQADPLSPPGSSEQDNGPVNVDAILQSILGWGAERFGIAAAVLRGERIIAQGAAGVRKRGTAERITLDDRFHLGSCTKAMTATLVAMLVEEGKLNWTTTLGQLFADTVKPMHPAWEKVTLRQVLAHRAGLRFEPDGLAQLYNELARPLRARRLGTLPQQRLEIARQALSRPPKIPPDTKYWYSNVGYVLAGAVLEQLTGRAWEELMRERLFQPLGISTGGFGAPGAADKTEQAWGHSPVLGKPLDPRSPAAEIPLYYGPAGLAHMTVTDWAKFIALHLRGDPANPHYQAALLKLDTFAEMHAVAPGTFPLTPALNPVGTTSTSSQIHPANGGDVEVVPTRRGRRLTGREPAYSKGWVMRGITRLATGDAAPAVTYCAGWFISPASWAKGTRPGDAGRRLWHAGSNGRWNAGVVIAPEIDFAVLVACNRGIAAWKTRQTVKALIRTFAPKGTS